MTHPIGDPVRGPDDLERRACSPSAAGSEAPAWVAVHVPGRLGDGLLPRPSGPITRAPWTWSESLLLQRLARVDDSPCRSLWLSIRLTLSASSCWRRSSVPCSPRTRDPYLRQVCGPLAGVARSGLFTVLSSRPSPSLADPPARPRSWRASLPRWAGDLKSGHGPGPRRQPDVGRGRCRDGGGSAPCCSREPSP